MAGDVEQIAPQEAGLFIPFQMVHVAADKSRRREQGFNPERLGSGNLRQQGALHLGRQRQFLLHLPPPGHFCSDIPQIEEQVAAIRHPDQTGRALDIQAPPVPCPHRPDRGGLHPIRHQALKKLLLVLAGILEQLQHFQHRVDRPPVAGQRFEPGIDFHEIQCFRIQQGNRVMGLHQQRVVKFLPLPQLLLRLFALGDVLMKRNVTGQDSLVVDDGRDG